MTWVAYGLTWVAIIAVIAGAALLRAQWVYRRNRRRARRR